MIVRWLILLATCLSVSAQVSFDGPAAGAFSRARPAAGGGGGCSTFRQNNSGATAGDQYIAYDGSDLYFASPFTASASYTVCSVTNAMFATGSPGFNLKCAIYTDSGSNPGTLVGTASAAVSASTIGTSEATVTFTGLNAAVTSGTKYWIVIWVSGGSTSYYTSYLHVPYSVGVSTDVLAKSSDGTTWSQPHNYSLNKYGIISQ